MSIYAGHRFSYNNLVTDSTDISPLNQAPGYVESYTKTQSEGGSALLYAAGDFTGAVNLTIWAQIDSIAAGDDIGNATFRYRYDTTATGAWEASGQATATTGTSVGNDVLAYFESVGDTDFAVGDTFEIRCKAAYGPGNLLDLTRTSRWRSTDFDDEELLDNNDFENGFTGGLADDWTKTGDSQTYSEETSTVHTASGSAQKIVCVATGESIGISQAQAVTAGEYYWISVWVYQDTERTFTIQHDNLTGNTTTALIPATTWTQVTWTVKADATGSQSLILENTIADSAPSDYVIIDDVEFRPLPYLTIDLGSAQQATALILGDNNWSTSATIFREANASDAWTSPSVDTTITNQNPAIEYFDNTYRYHRIVIDDMENSDGYSEIFNLFLGTYFEPEHPTVFGSPYHRNLVMFETAMPNGDRLQYARSKQKHFPLAWPDTNQMSTTELNNFITMRDALVDLTTGDVSPVWFHFAYDEDDTLFLMKWTDIHRVQQGLVNYLTNTFSMDLLEVPKRGV